MGAGQSVSELDNREGRRERGMGRRLSPDRQAPLKTCAKKKDADRYEATSRVEVMHGTHTADSASVTIAEAGKRWIKCAQCRLERSTRNEAHLK